MLARERGATSAGQQAESIIEPRGDLLNGKHSQARCGQFQGEGNAIQTVDDFRNGSSILFRESKIRIDSVPAIEEDLYCFGGPYRLCSWILNLGRE